MQRLNFNPFERDEEGQFLFDFIVEDVTPLRLMELSTQHSHRLPEGNTINLLEALRKVFYKVALFVESTLPPSRERSLTQTKIDEARMWACNAATLQSPVMHSIY